MTAKRRYVPRIALVVAEPRWRADPKALSLIRRAARLGMTAGAQSKHARKAPAGEAAVTILLDGDPGLRALNLRFRKKDKPTNVLSFPSPSPPYVGDIALSYQTIATEARAQGKLFAHHAAHMALHGVLHLLGHDHKRKSQAEEMEGCETALLAKLKIAPPYESRALSKRAKRA